VIAYRQKGLLLSSLVLVGWAVVKARVHQLLRVL
jgi:hypothetical protein